MYSVNPEVQRKGQEFLMLQNFEVLKLTDGFGYGHGTISVEERIDDNSDPLDRLMLDRVSGIIMTDQILVGIDKDQNGRLFRDDGCGDGRPTGEITRGTRSVSRSYNRAKVFGGGAVMAVSASIGLGEAKQPLLRQFIESISTLNKSNIDFGGHSDEDSYGVNCGCGAIDKAPQIISNVNKFAGKIKSSIEAFASVSRRDEFPLTDSTLDSVIAFYFEYSEKTGSDDYSGKEIYQDIADTDKVMKKLSGDHKEVAIVINTEPKMTPNQTKIRSASKGVAQIFSLDEWRVKELAENLYPDRYDDKKRTRAYYSMLIYNLSVAATLTRGDLPVFVARSLE
jgi:hypothetical protein